MSILSMSNAVSALPNMLSNLEHLLRKAYEGQPETFAECYDVLAKAKTDIANVAATDLDGKEGREFSLKMGPSVPNIYFHMTTVYNILRHNGVPLGKIDYFGGSK